MSARPSPFSCPPYRMRVQDAAAFCGEAVSTFRGKVADGRFPKPAWTEGGRVYWRTQDLIEAMENAQPIAPDKPMGGSPTQAQIRELELQRRAS